MSAAYPIRLFCILLFLLFFSGCAQIGYYVQSIRGQLDIWSRERPIQEVIDDQASSPVLREKLALVLKAREFASRELGLPQNQSYRRYADLRRPYVVWNVFATEEFSTRPLQWCFMIAGCVSYRGYFTKEDADSFAAEVAAQGHDVHVGGVPAYSTLGWFADPVLNTIISYPTSEVARIIFHELSHQVVYVPDDSVFNESFAVTVERAGVRRWLAANGSPQDRQNFERRQRYRTDFIALVQACRARLDVLYREPVSASDMRVRKREIFEEFKRDYAALKASWGEFAGYDRWFAQAPNNALLATVSIYTGHVAAFEAILLEHGGDLPKFFTAVKALARLQRTKRDAILRKYSPALDNVGAV